MQILDSAFFLPFVRSFFYVFFLRFLPLALDGIPNVCAHTHTHTTTYKMYAEKNGSHIYSAIVFVWTVWFNGCTHIYIQTNTEHIVYSMYSMRAQEGETQRCKCRSYTSRFHVRILFYRTWNGKHEHSAVLNWIEMIVYFFINPQFVWKKANDSLWTEWRKL